MAHNVLYIYTTAALTHIHHDHQKTPLHSASCSIANKHTVSVPVGGRINTTLQWVNPPHSYNHHRHIYICIPPPPKTNTTQCKLLEWTILIPSMPCLYCVPLHSGCIVHSTSAGADPELVGGSGGWSCMLLLHPVPTCTDASPDLCTWHPDLCTLCLQWLSLSAIYGGGASPSAIGTDSTCTCNLHWWCFSFYTLTQIPDFHSGNLHCVVVFTFKYVVWNEILHCLCYVLLCVWYVTSCLYWVAAWPMNICQWVSPSF